MRRTMIQGKHQANPTEAIMKPTHSIPSLVAELESSKHKDLQPSRKRGSACTSRALRAMLAGVAVVMLMTTVANAGETLPALKSTATEASTAQKMVALVASIVCPAMSVIGEHSCSSGDWLSRQAGLSQDNDQPQEVEFEYYDGATKYLGIEHSIYTTLDAPRGPNLLIVVAEPPTRGFDLGAEVLFRYSF